MARFSLIFLTLFVAVLVSNVNCRAATIEDENIVDVDIKEKKDDELDKKILELKRKVKELIEQNKENEKAFLSMTDQVTAMDKKVKEMTDRLRKVNQADYLNAGAKEIENL